MIQYLQRFVVKKINFIFNLEIKSITNIIFVFGLIRVLLSNGTFSSLSLKSIFKPTIQIVIFIATLYLPCRIQLGEIFWIFYLISSLYLVIPAFALIHWAYLENNTHDWIKAFYAFWGLSPFIVYPLIANYMLIDLGKDGIFKEILSLNFNFNFLLG